MKRCEYVSHNPAYGRCTRMLGHEGPCAHKLKAEFKPKPTALEVLETELKKRLEVLRKDKVGGKKGEKWAGPCGDSFCYAGCDMATCRWEFQLGKTPYEHDQAIEAKVRVDPSVKALRTAIKALKDQK